MPTPYPWNVSKSGEAVDAALASSGNEKGILVTPSGNLPGGERERFWLTKGTGLTQRVQNPTPFNT
jgi:hypothetical protein